MKRSILILALTLICALPGAAADTVRVAIEFQHVEPATIVEELGLEDVTITSMTYRWADQKAIYVARSGDSTATIAAKFAERLETMLAHDSAGMLDVEAQLADLRSRGLGISGVEIEGKTEAVTKTIRALEKNAYVSLIEPVRRIRTDASLVPQTLGGQPYTDPWKFSPSSGSVTHNPATKTMTSSFRWTDVSGFDSTHKGYEHDLLIRNLGGVTLNTDALYTSNLPGNWYVDDPFGDDVPILSVGTDGGPAIKANTTYYVQVGYNTSWLSDPNQPGRLDVQPQLGSWAGTYDDGGWPDEDWEKNYCNGRNQQPRHCIFADQTHTTLKFYADRLPTSPVYVLAPFSLSQARTVYWDKNFTLSSKVCNSDQYRAEYFKSTTSHESNNLMFVRCENALSQNWGASGPEPDMTDNFSVRWTRQVAYAEGRYRFTTVHDDGMRVTIGGVQRLNEWYDQASRTSTFDVDLWGGSYTVVAEYYERTGAAGVSLVSKLQTPVVPSWINAAYVSNQVRLTWPDTFGETSYVFEMRLANGSWSQAGTVSANNTSWIVPLSFVPGQTYSFRMRAMNAAGYSPYGNEASVWIPGNVPATVLYESAESGAPGWSLGSGWIMQTSTASAVGSKRFLVGNGTSYWNNMNTSLTSPAFSLANRSSMRLTFAYKHDIESGWDYFWLELSHDNGVTWTPVTAKWTGTYPGGTGWARADYTFYGPYAGKNAVRLRFRFTSDKDIVKWGAAVDDIRIIAQ